MAAKEIRVECPCCRSKLEVDVLTEKVMRILARDGERESPESSGQKSWKAASERVNQRSQSAVDKLEDSLKREKARTEDLDELFRKVKEKHEPGPGDEHSS